MDAKCALCPALAKSRKRVVPGRGAERPLVMFVGEAPGQEEDKQGIPFCGMAGEVLAALAAQAGLGLKEIYLDNACACRPPGNRAPKSTEIANCRPRLLETIRQVQPRVLVSLGACALESLWQKAPIENVIGQMLVQADTGLPLVPTYHPAFVLRQWQKSAIVLHCIEKAARIARQGPNVTELGIYTPVLSLAELSDLRDYVLSNEIDLLAFDTECTGLDYMRDELLCVSLCAEPGRAFVVPLLRQGLVPAWTTEQWPEVVRLMRDIFSSPVPKAAQNGLFDLRFLERNVRMQHVEAQTVFGWRVENLCWDTLIMSRLLCQDVPHGLAALAAYWLDFPYYEAEILATSSNKRRMDVAPDQVLWQYAGADADVVRRLVPVLEAQCRKLGMDWLLQKIIMPVIRSLWEMEKRGVLVDRALFDKLCAYYRNEIAAKEAELFRIAGGPTKYHGVPLRKLLFERLCLPIPNARTDSAASCPECRKLRDRPCLQHISTSMDTLRQMHENNPHPVLPVILDLLKLTKFEGTYLAGAEGKNSGYGRHIRPDGRIHPQFKVGFADTGRHSCEEPNLQNIPKGVEIAELGLHDALRQIFVAPPGHVVMAADWAQLEVWGLAYQTGDKTLLRLLRGGEDIHCYVARRLCESGIAPDLFPDVGRDLDDYEWSQQHKDLRRKAKPFVFGISYGLTPEGAAERLGCSFEAASALLDYYKTSIFPTLPRYFEWVEQQLLTQARLPNIFGRWRFFPEVPILQRLSKRTGRYRGELKEQCRVGINFPIQSSGHDLHQAAHNLIEATPSLLERAVPILEVHDSLYLYAVDKGQEYLVETAWIIKNLWESLAKYMPLPDGSPLGWEVKVEVEWGPSIGESHWRLTANGNIIDLRGMEEQ